MDINGIAADVVTLNSDLDESEVLAKLEEIFKSENIEFSPFFTFMGKDEDGCCEICYSFTARYEDEDNIVSISANYDDSGRNLVAYVSIW